MRNIPNFKIHPTVIVNKNVNIKEGVVIGPFCYIGYSFYDQRSKYYGNNYKQGFPHDENNETVVGSNTFIGPNTIIGEGAKIGENCLIEHNCYIGENSKLGKNVFLRYGCKIYKNVEIGDNCIISGFLCNNTRIGNDVEFFGKTAHRYLNREMGKPESAPSILDGVFVAFNVLIIGGITIEKKAIIKAGAIVTRDIKAKEVIGPNKKV